MDATYIGILEMDPDNLQSPNKYTLGEFRCFVARYCSALLSSGIKQGDVVARELSYLNDIVS